MKCSKWKDRICSVRNLPCEVVKDCPEYHDLTPKEIVRKADELIRGGATIWIKFTCHHCGSRQTSDTPNALHTGGYTCEECGKLSYPMRFGFMLEAKVS